MRLHLGCQAVRAGGGRLTVRGPVGAHELPYDALLLGTGRKANVDCLSLEAAGVRLGGDGVEVDEYLRTSNPNIYAAGDVAFPQKFTHAAMATARLCIANAQDGANRRARDLVIPRGVFAPRARGAKPASPIAVVRCPQAVWRGSTQRRHTHRDHPALPLWTDGAVCRGKPSLTCAHGRSGVAFTGLDTGMGGWNGTTARRRRRVR